MTTATMIDEVFYFGCWGEAGHHLWDRHKRMLHGRYRADQVGLPVRDHDLDGGPFLPKPEKVGQGALCYVRGWTILSWWGSPWDKRGAVCAAIMVKGVATAEGLWRAFAYQFPTVAQHLEPPLVVNNDFAAFPSASGYVIGNGDRTKWRTWGDSGPEWTTDADAALQFVRRRDAEAVAAEDEDAWGIVPVAEVQR